VFYSLHSSSPLHFAFALVAASRAKIQLALPASRIVIALTVENAAAAAPARTSAIALVALATSKTTVNN